MIEFADLFSSKAKTKTLQILAKQSSGLSLRYISTLANMPIFSIKRAAEDLMKKKILIRELDGNRTLFSLNAKNPISNLIRKIISEVEIFEIEQKANSYHRIAANTLDFNKSAQKLIKKARKSLYES